MHKRSFRWIGIKSYNEIKYLKVPTYEERLDVYWIVHNFVRVHFTTRQVPAVALKVLEHGLSLNEIFFIQKRLSGFVEAACASGAILERISLTRDSHQEEKPDATLRGPHPKPSTVFGSNRLHRGRISSPVVFFYRSISSLCR